MAGLVVATVYAEFFSLFHGVSLAALGILLAVNVCIIIRWKREQSFTGTDVSRVDEQQEGKPRQEIWNNQFFRIRGNSCNPRTLVIKLLGFCTLALVFAYASSRGYMHYDSDLYHAQSIRWIEEYGAVRGLANLHNRLGYNSAAFPLSALYSFSFLGIQSFHAVTGYLALLIALECLKVLRVFSYVRENSRNKKSVIPSPADFVRIAGLFYLFAVIDEIVSPASDYFMVLIAFYIVIRFLEADCRVWSFCMLSLLAVFNVTVKLSAAMLVLLALLPFILLLRRHAYRQIGLLLLTGFCIALPFFIRNIILTGYLVYPFPSVDLFHVPWKVPFDAALLDAREIKVWGRGFTDPSLYDLPIRIWVKPWFSTLSRIDRLLLLTAAITTLPVLLYLVTQTVRASGQGLRIPYAADQQSDYGTNNPGKNKDDCPQDAVLLTVQLSLIASCTFWFSSAPLIRYGCVFVYSLAALNLGILYNVLFRHISRYPVTNLAKHRGMSQDARLSDLSGMKAGVFRIALFLFLAYKVIAVGREQSQHFINDHWLQQQDYGQYAVTQYWIGPEIFYYPTAGDQCGYAVFPSSPTDRSHDIILMGDSIADGFEPVW